MNIKVLIFIIAFVPIVGLGSYVYYRDKNKEPVKILIEMFLAGIASTFISVMLSLLLGKIVPGYTELYNSKNYVGLYASSLISVALLQEFSKWVLVYILGYNNKEYDEPYDMIVYALFLSLGFAFIENLIYGYDGGVYISLFKVFGDVILQACMGIFIGYFISLAKLAHMDNKPYIKYIILMKIVDSAAQSSARTIDRSMKNGNFSEAQRERMREQRDSLKEMHKQYEKTKKEEAWAKEEEERNNY